MQDALTLRSCEYGRFGRRTSVIGIRGVCIVAPRPRPNHNRAPSGTLSRMGTYEAKRRVVDMVVKHHPPQRLRTVVKLAICMGDQARVHQVGAILKLLLSVFELCKDMHLQARRAGQATQSGCILTLVDT